MMSTYEIVVALFSATSPSTTEVTTLQPRKVLLTGVDAEANAPNEAKT